MSLRRHPMPLKPVAAGRRRFLTRAGTLGALVLSSGVFDSWQPLASGAQSGTFAEPNGRRYRLNDTAILNFALNLEYLEAEFYLRATTGAGLAEADTSGAVAINLGSATGHVKSTAGAAGVVTGGTKVNFQSAEIASYANEIAADEQAHVRFLRSNIPTRDLVARPAIDFTNAFTSAAQAAGIITAGQTFDPFASDNNFLLGAFIFEDVGVTAYEGASPYVSNSAYLSAAAGILGTEAYHAGLIRTTLFTRGQNEPLLIDAANKISALRASASGAADDQGISNSDGTPHIVPVDTNGRTFSRTFQQVLNIVYLGKSSSGGFFPNGVNGYIS